jgi:hypothetical protein
VDTDVVVAREVIIKEAVTISDSFGVQRRHYLASDHLLAASMSSRFCSEYEMRNSGKGLNRIHRTHAMTAVMSSVAFLESLVNEIYQDAAEGVPDIVDPLPPECWQMLAEFWKSQSQANLVLKAQMALLFAGKPKIDMGDGIGQELGLLIAWRNALIHYKPEWHGDEQPTKLEQRLSGRFPRSTLVPANSPDAWPVWALGAGGAAWSNRVARDFADEWTARLGVSPPYLTEMSDAIARRSDVPVAERTDN